MTPQPAVPSQSAVPGLRVPGLRVPGLRVPGRGPGRAHSAEAGGGAPPARLDPREPLVLSTRELGRRPGSMRQLSLTVSAPAGLAVGTVSVAPGAEVELDLRLESVVEGVLVSGSARAATAGECSRCLDPVEGELVTELQELFTYDPAEDPEDETPLIDGELIDLEPVVRDAVVLALPLKPVCRADCPGLCPECGQRLADDPGHQHEILDSRWAALRQLDVTGDTDTGQTDPDNANRKES